jgi:hypothetical protein
MLQIVSGKFFKGDRTFDTPHKGTFYTNYRFADETPIDTDVGRLLPSAEIAGVETLAYELTEKIEWQEIRSGVMTSTGGRELIAEFADVAAFALNVICTPDPDLCGRLILPKSGGFSAESPSAKFMPRVFNPTVAAEPNDSEKLASLIRKLIALPRKRYEVAIRAICQYVSALCSVGTDATLAYSLLITSIEAIAQGVDLPDATWDDFDQRKRSPIDRALEGAPSELADAVRAAVLESEHVALGRRFREFIKSHIDPEFYRSEAAKALQAVNRRDLDYLLKDAYSIRSAYVHRLESLSRILDSPFGHQEMYYVEDQPTLTFAGLARVSRHVILQFIDRSMKVEREDFDWNSALPNIIRMQLASQYWIGNADCYTAEMSGRWLEALIEQVSEALLSRSKPVTNLTPILDKIDEMPISQCKKGERRAMLALYYIFTCYAGPGYERPNWPVLWAKYREEIDEPCVETVSICLFSDQEFPWSLVEVEALHDSYFQKRRHKASLHLGGLFEPLFTLRLAELHRASGNATRSRELISFAVETSPGNKLLLDLEVRSASGDLEPINPRDILLPKMPATKGSA